MKRKIVAILIHSVHFAMVITGCKKGDLENLHDFYYVAESESGNVLLGLDEKGNVLSYLDENGNSIDLSDCVIERDNDGNVVAVFLADGSKVNVKEKASEEVVNQVLQGGSINHAENSPEKKPESTSEKKSEKESEVESEKASEVKSEKTEKTSEIEGLVPGVNAPALPKTNPTQSGVSDEVQKQIDQLKAQTLAEMEKERGLDDSKISATIGIVMYTRTDDTGGMIKVYRGPGEEYGVVEDNGAAASISTFPFREFAVQVLASTDNGWYKIKYSSTKSRYAFEIAAEHDVEGYVRQTDLVSEDENTTRVAEREKQAAAIREQAELETEKYEKELAEKEKKLKEKEEKEKKEKASEKTSEKDSEKESEKASEEKSEEVSEKASETTSEVASEISSETEITSEDSSEEISSEVTSEQKEPVSEIGSEKSSELNGNEKALNGGEKEKEENGSEKKEE